MIDQIKTVIFLIVFCLAGPSAALADWKTDINQYLKEKKYDEAQILLESNLPSLSEPDRQEALALLPYVFNRQGQMEKEKQAIVNYFEEYNQAEPLFQFLDFSVFNPVLEFWGQWKEEYPGSPTSIFWCRSQPKPEPFRKCFAWALTCQLKPIIKFS